MTEFSPQSTCHTLIDEVLSVERTGNHFLQSPCYDRSPLFDMFCCFPAATTADASTSNGPPSREELLFEDELMGWDDLSDEVWLEPTA